MGSGTWLLAMEEGPGPGVPGSASMVFEVLRELAYLPVSEGAGNMCAGGVTL